ncbi:MAG: sugar-binding domain-containing protein [Oscillospiraceae bacterium]
MNRKFHSALVYRVARYYYIDNLSQNEIAQKEQISRSTVSRILDRARASGIVNIEINVPTDSIVDRLEEKLCRRLGIERAIVVPASVNESTDETEEQLIVDVASVAAAHLPEFLGNAKTIGVGWGRTLYNIPPYLPFVHPDPERIFLPLVGNMTLRNRFLQTSINVSRFGERFGSQTYYLNISSLRGENDAFSEAETYNVRQIQDYWNHLDAAIYSLGSPPLYNDMYLKEELGPDKFSVTDSDPDGRGEMLSQVYFSDGRQSCPIGPGMSVVALPLEKLREVHRTICVAAGNYKAEPIFYAARNGYFRTLVVDHLLAEELLRVSQT